MSVNHFSSNPPDPLWWAHPHHPYPTVDADHRQPPSTSVNFNLNDHDSSHGQIAAKEPMFEKPLTPSDVGKLNRLVIPKQYAEKYFPLGGSDPVNVDQQKGLLLSFEDETGKLWRFRYSYWNSSQSYVLTKGWSRFVKEKRLESGDVVLFQRDRFDFDRLYVGWRRRPAQDSVGVPAQVSGWTTAVIYDARYGYRSQQHHLPISLPHPYQPNCHHAGGGINEIVENNRRNDVASGNPRRVRLFGVNLECPDESEPSTPDGSSQGSNGLTHHQYYTYANNLNHNMNINFSQMRQQ